MARIRQIHPVRRHEMETKGPFLRYHEVPFGQVPLHVLLNASEPAPHLSSYNSVSDVYTILGSCGLPPELALDIMELAGYGTAQRRLIVPHDPLHPRNQDALLKYLTHCWLTLVRCNMFFKELDIDINWKSEVFHSLERIVGVPKGTKLYKAKYDHENLYQNNGTERWHYCLLNARGTDPHTIACIELDY
ncbi:uncharacterized protein BDV14DRAFT_129255 [Aspergillus stella-maris]|uniref:uncharacterized protein n=1 Tax=Aspergillus stella-maris TaxID=1810926 RepID=UPI003CCE03D9